VSLHRLHQARQNRFDCSSTVTCRTTARSSLEGLEEIDRVRHYDPSRGYRQVPLRERLEWEFFHDPATSAPGMRASIAEAEWTGTAWKVTLQGWCGARAVLTLSKRFELMNLVEIPKTQAEKVRGEGRRWVPGCATSWGGDGSCTGARGC